MVDVVNEKCGDDGCPRVPWFGVEGSEQQEFRAQHAMTGMGDVVHRKCHYDGCPAYPSQGVAESRKREFCAQHAREGMVDVTHRRCGAIACSRRVACVAKGVNEVTL